MSESPSPMEAFAEFHRKLMESIAAPLTGESYGGWTSELTRALSAEFAHHASQWKERQQQYMQRQLELWQRYIGAADASTPVPPPRDRRFRGTGWQQPYFAYLAESHLLRQQWLQEVVNSAALTPREKRKLAFLAQQYVDAMSPANFAWSNPEALQRAIETKGASIAAGLKNLSGDLERGRISNVDRSAFSVGGNLALTPGDVVFQNDLIQLIQYRPSTERVYERPFVIVPPCINRYYILDLQQDNSLVAYAVSRGHTVFMVSWRSAGDQIAHLTWDDYLEQGIMPALEIARRISGARDVNALGFCIGGTLLASALAVLFARGERPVRSLTLLAAMLDFTDTGDLGIFIDEPFVAQRERSLAAGGILRGEELALAFASLRANDLIWRYVVNNYLLGNTPEAFDLLYWNDDSTNLPGPMYVYYLRNMYLENNLRVPGRLAMCGTPVDLSTIDVPTFAVAAKEDHIVPWQTAYASAGLLGGKIEFVLTASGHIAGVVNPPPGRRRRYWAGAQTSPDSRAWLDAAPVKEGSWWPHWGRWLARQGGKRIAARSAGSDAYRPIEPAPGRYVMERSTTNAREPG